MRRVQVLTLLTVISWAASDAWAQYGLYGSPEIINVPPMGSVDQSVPRDPGYAAPDNAAGPAAGYPAYPMHSILAERARKDAAEGRKKRKKKEEAKSVVDEMLDEWGRDAPEAPCEPEYECGEAYCGPCAPPARADWYVSVSGLIMGRDRPNRLWTTYEDGNNPNQLPTDIRFDWRGGGEVRFGRYFCCGAWALEATYWTLDGFSGLAVQSHANDVSCTLDFTDVVWANPAIAAIRGAPVDLFDGAEEHRVWRSDELHNVEVNLIRNRLDWGDSDPFDVDWSAGVRYFRFDDDLLFGSLRQGGLAFGVDPTLEGYLHDYTVNSLVGVQFGCHLTYRRGDWQLFMVPRVGIYNNHIRHWFSGYGGDGALFAVAPAGYPPYPVSSSTNVVSFLTQIDLGLEWQFATRWSAHIGYRVLVATGMALADHQIPPYVVDTPELANIDHNGQLILHGGFAGLTYRF